MRCYKGKTILVTGHTGFKGTWLCRALLQLGANVYGVGLDEGRDKIFFLSDTRKDMQSYLLDIRDRDACAKIIMQINPHMVFHLAAQPLVLESYKFPVETFDTNIMGTVHILDICRHISHLEGIVMITTDKVYQNNEWVYAYRESDQLGAHDPYSASKSMCELAISSYKHSFYTEKGIDIVSARAGNVIGGGDFSSYRIIPDIIRAIQSKQPVILRNPKSIRPWQHVADVILAYLLIGYHLFNKTVLSSSYNIAPSEASSEEYTVERLVQLFLSTINKGSYIIQQDITDSHEMINLRLDPSLIMHDLHWTPYFSIQNAIRRTAEEYNKFLLSQNSFKDIIDDTITECLHQYTS